MRNQAHLTNIASPFHFSLFLVRSFNSSHQLLAVVFVRIRQLRLPAASQKNNNDYRLLPKETKI